MPQRRRIGNDFRCNGALRPLARPRVVKADTLLKLPPATGFGDQERMRRALIRSSGQSPQALRGTALGKIKRGAN